jgi:hypothetical protein
MVHARRKIAVTTSGTTNMKGVVRNYKSRTVEFGYPQDDVSLTNRARNEAATAYKQWLRTTPANSGGLQDPKEINFLTLTQSHRIKND